MKSDIHNFTEIKSVKVKSGDLGDLSLRPPVQSSVKK